MARTHSHNSPAKRKRHNDIPPSVLALKQKAAKLFHKREYNLTHRPHSGNIPIIISDDNDDNDTSSITPPNDLIIISDDEVDIQSTPPTTNAKQIYVIADDSDTEMEDSSTALLKAGFGDSSNGVLNQSIEASEEGSNINPLQPNHRTQSQSLKRPQENSGDNEAGHDKNFMKTYYPWWQSNNRQHQSLQSQVLDFIDYLKPKKHEILLRRYVVHKVRHVLKAEWEGAQVNVFGSLVTKTFLPGSDIDMVVTLPKLAVSLSLNNVASALKKSDICHGFPQIIWSATVPVLKCVDALTRINIDIILASKNGVECAEHMSNILDRYPAARELTLMVKHMVDLRYLNTVYTGGIGGLSVTCLVIRFLQEHSKYLSGTIDLDQDLGDLLSGFFYHYGPKFKLGEVSISIAGRGSSSTKRVSRGRNGQRMFSITHPLDPTNDLGAKSFRASAIVQMFKATYKSMVPSTSSKTMVGNRNLNIRASGAFPKPKCDPSCLLSEIGFISTAIVNQRALLEEVYVGKKWRGDLAAATFNWNMDI